jgi:hypothetical protein
MRQRPRRPELVALLAAAAVTGAGSGAALSRAAPRTPKWLTDLARNQAMELGDPSPRRKRITVGRVDVIRLWGRFVCGKSCYMAPGAPPPCGNYVRITVDPSTHAIDGLELRRVR